MSAHPMQQIVRAEDGVVRFRANKIVVALLERSRDQGYGLNELFAYAFSNEDWEQFAQLIGYSVAGFGTLLYVSEAQVRQADAAAERLLRGVSSETRLHECPTCICGKRVPVQGDYGSRAKRGPGSIAWEEHLRAWSGYAARYGTEQSAEHMAERGGFSYSELVQYLGHEPETWEPRRVQP